MVKGLYINIIIGFTYVGFLFLISWNQSGGDIFLAMGLTVFFTIHLSLIFIVANRNDDSLIKGVLFGWLLVLVLSIVVFRIISQSRQSIVPHTIIGFPD